MRSHICGIWGLKNSGWQGFKLGRFLLHFSLTNVSIHLKRDLVERLYKVDA